MDCEINLNDLLNSCPFCHAKMELKRKIMKHKGKVNDLNNIPMIVPFWQCTGCGVKWVDINSEKGINA